MRKPQGYAITVEPGKPDVEEDTITCGHCNTVHFVKPKQDPSELGGFCRMCMKYICGPCVDEGSCTPYEKKMERAEARDRLLRAALGIR